MRENVDILGVFHDGSIVEILGALPKISFRIEIEYLRNMFPSKGDSFLAHVSECESIVFYNWENETRTNELAEIQKEEPEILSIEQQDDTAHIICSTGELDVLYKKIEFQLDSGAPVTFQELTEACNNYWDDWESRKIS
ncbi:hypothetical protein [Teredinibacter franksiae]|uniref:hypothetical protein n=1 Tax=Teredinibacter franksiae TaxID=2761453 RepID=UPI0016239255|nr:hypothetical protein [Teredinibacter franksiae]